MSDKWAFNAYALLPTGTTNSQLNTVYEGGALDTYGLDAGYNLTPALRASVGYYYQNGDAGAADGSGVLRRLAYAINNGLTVGTNLSYDSAFKSRFSADIKWRFQTNGGPGKETLKTNAAVSALTSTLSNRDVRVHDLRQHPPRKRHRRDPSGEDLFCRLTTQSPCKRKGFLFLQSHQ